MGASGWSHRTAYHGDLSAAMEALQRRVFADGDYYWPYEFHAGILPPKPRPASIDELWQDEYAQEEGTHSIMDVSVLIGPGDPDAAGTVRPLTPAETRELFGTDQPAPEQFDHAADHHALPDTTPTGSAVCMLLFVDGKPAEVAFWGFTGD